MKEQLIALAVKARQDIESGKVDKTLLARLYREYNPQVKDLEAFIDYGLAIFPNLCCGIASVYLRHLLGDGEVVQGNFNGQRHTYLLVESKVVDITSDQYNGPRVYIGELITPWQ